MWTRDPRNLLEGNFVFDLAGNNGASPVGLPHPILSSAAFLQMDERSRRRREWLSCEPARPPSCVLWREFSQQFVRGAKSAQKA